MASFSTFLTPWTLFLGALVIVVVAIIVLTVIERKLNKRIVAKKEEEQTYFQRQLEDVRVVETDPTKFLDKLDDSVRLFFSEKFGVGKNTRYSDLVKEFRKKGNLRAAKFCERLQEARYGGDGLDSNGMAALMREFEAFVIDVSAIEEQKDREKKKESYWGKEIDLKKVTKSIVSEKKEEVVNGANHLDVKEFERMGREEEKMRESEEKESRRRLEESQGERKEEWARMTKEVRKKEIAEPELTDVVPYIEEKIKIKKSKRKIKDRAYERVGSIDDLDRVKTKIRAKRNSWAISGIAVD